MDNCPGCGLAYENCDCPATLGAATEPITGRLLWRAACKMQRAGLPIATGQNRNWFPEKDIDCGKVNPSKYVDNPNRANYDRWYDKHKRNKRKE